MQRVIITGANGAGKSHVARQLAQTRPDLPLISYDALRLTENWIKKSPEDIREVAARAVAKDNWILEGGPSVLDHALTRSDAVIWLDPPERLRACRLFVRPWKNFGRTRAEVPDGNVDWPLQQYRFALRSLRIGRAYREKIGTTLGAHPSGIGVWRCRNQEDVSTALKALAVVSLDG